MDRSKILLIVTGSNVSPWDKNWMECANTWIPLLKQLGYHVKVSIADENLDDYFLDECDIIKFKSSVGKDGLFERGLTLPLRWILENTNYQYYFKVDSDTFIHPKRFDNMLIENIQDGFDYLGACTPYRGWDTNDNFKEHMLAKDGDFFFASGAGYCISRRIMALVLNDLKIENHWELFCEDYILGRTMKNLGIPLLHDNKICIESPFMEVLVKSADIKTPYIGDRDSHLAMQHYMHKNMSKAINDLIK